MAIIVEDGTKKVDANAYITVQFFRDWHSVRGLAAAATDTGSYGTALIEAAIVKATDYVDKRFGPKFVGYKYSRDQALQWPRQDAFDIDGDSIKTDEIPNELKRAVVEYAKIALAMELLAVPAPSFNKYDPSTGETEVSEGGMIMRKAEKVGPISEETWYNQDQWRVILQGLSPARDSPMVSAINLPEYPVADEWLKPIMKIGGQTRLVLG